MTRASRSGIRVPSLLYVSIPNSSIYMERVHGVSVKDFFYSKLDSRSLDINEVSRKIGMILWKLHSNGIIHGDLTTSNLILQPDGNIVLFLNNFSALLILDYRIFLC